MGGPIRDAWNDSGLSGKGMVFGLGITGLTVFFLAASSLNDVYNRVPVETLELSAEPSD